MTSGTATLTPADRPRADLAVKLLRTALDVAAGDGEAENAATKFVRSARRSGVTFNALAAAIIAGEQPRAVVRSTPPVAWFVAVPFGRHEGATLGHVATADIGYLRWLSTECRDLDLQAAAAAVLAYVTAGGCHG